MRLAYVCQDPGVPVFGRKGCSIHCQEGMRALRDRGFDIELFAVRPGTEVPQDLSDIVIHHLPLQSKLAAAAKERALMELNTAVHRRLESCRPFDLVYERYSLWSVAAMQFAKAAGIPGLLEVNAPLIEEQSRYRSLINWSYARRLSDECLQKADSIIAVSDEVARKVCDHSLVASKTTVVHNGVDVNRFRRRGESRPRDGKMVIGFVGTLKPWHGVTTLLGAFAEVLAQIPNACLRIVGDGPERTAIYNQIQRMPVEFQGKVEWTGSIAHADMPRTISAFDIAVAPYPAMPQFYFSPLKIMEYLAAGLPVVASDIGQIREVITHRQTGWLVKPGSWHELAGALIELCRDAKCRQELGAAARDYAEKNLSWQEVMNRILGTVAMQLPQGETA